MTPTRSGESNLHVGLFIAVQLEPGSSLIDGPVEPVLAGTFPAGNPQKATFSKSQENEAESSPTVTRCNGKVARALAERPVAFYGMLRTSPERSSVMTKLAPRVMPLDTAHASIELFGGKGRALAMLATKGLPVPRGFVISTQAYKDFARTNELERALPPIMSEVDVRDVSSIESASSKIRALFETAPLPEELLASIRGAYGALDAGSGVAVAVRSSATAEDLPDLSFAGQHDTYLNVRGEAALIIAVRRCWASLWSARAIGYRARMNAQPERVAMGVVVQVMVEAEVSGILFTASPTTGTRSEIVVNATFGLGEAVVAGQVTPDTFVLDRNGFTVKQAFTHSKLDMIVSASDQGTRTEPVPEPLRDEPAMSVDLLSRLAALGLAAEELLGGQPQDIEWAVAQGECWLLQSRPITSLPTPTPSVSWEPPYAGAKLVRRQVVENMPEPLSPLFEELYLGEGLDRGMDRLVADMGLPFGVDDFITRPMFVTVNGYGYSRYDIRASWRMLLLIPRVLYWYARSLPHWLRNLVPLWREHGLADYLATIESWKRVDPQERSDQELISGIRALASADAGYWFYITMMVGAAKVTESLLGVVLSSRALEGKSSASLLLRGFPSKTLQSHHDLAAIARKLAASKSIGDLVLACPVDRLMEALERDAACSAILADLNEYLETYGHQVYNLDFVEPTQAEDPTPVLLSLRTLVRDPGSFEASAARHAAMAGERDSLVRKTSESLGPVRRWLFAKSLAWAQTYGPYREEALFYMGAAWPTLRRLAFELGRRLVRVGTLASADGVFYLNTQELEAACSARAEQAPLTDLGEQAKARCALREARKRLHPPGRVPEDLRFKLGPFDFTSMFEVWETQKRNASDASTLRGFAVSPGRVTGRASVIVSQAGFATMKPGTILVCPTTTPAWTPLFGQATGLVTDIGAILAHGSIVAREFGIPAVLGTGNVTTRVVSGQLITVDGDAGTVTILE